MVVLTSVLEDRNFMSVVEANLSHNNLAMFLAMCQTSWGMQVLFIFHGYDHLPHSAILGTNINTGVPYHQNMIITIHCNPLQQDKAFIHQAEVGHIEKLQDFSVQIKGFHTHVAIVRDKYHIIVVHSEEVRMVKLVHFLPIGAELVPQGAVWVENNNAVLAQVGDHDVVLAGGGDAVREVKNAVLGELRHELAVLLPNLESNKQDQVKLGRV